ncbi:MULTISPECIES: Ldh family oxidoreductase [unclassified Brevibacterium]|uniref:Ldh family oxidoreductase n=1 Tax=unclassified Brevibacterium TaxID=2614124 RepID=UPI0010F92D2C|nr:MULTISPECIES: Ldh family oxidoreductase [unclassified Brevibacterium]MCM1011296.1 Ldh family oxidoreductase [Brevibacterium sp. XM4083]
MTSGEAEEPLETIGFAALSTAIENRLIQAGASSEVSRILALNCASCERDGTLSHGVFRVRGYIDSLTRGWADGRAMPVVEEAGDSFIRVDGRNGFAQPALAAAKPAITAAIEGTGVAVVALRDSHHFSALWPDLEVFARDGCTAMAMIASGKLAVVPEGARRPVFSTNPFGFATPVAGTDPLVFDFSTSSMSHGDLQLAASDGVAVPPHTGVDAAGNESEDPKAILDGGGLRPFGGHKGALLSLMIETLAAGLTGGSFTYEVDMEAPTGAHTFRTGQLYIVIDPRRGGNESYPERVASFIDMLREAGMDRLPADRRYANRAAAEARGIPMSEEIRALLAGE